MKRVELIENYLEELFPNPKCELNYSKDYELLINIMLSAQTTDKRVNEVTKVLYDRYPSLEELKNADINDLKKILKVIKKKNYMTSFLCFRKACFSRWIVLTISNLSVNYALLARN